MKSLIATNLFAFRSAPAPGARHAEGSRPDVVLTAGLSGRLTTIDLLLGGAILILIGLVITP